MDNSRSLLKEGYSLFSDPYYLSFLPSLIELVKESKKKVFYTDPKRHLELQLGLMHLIETTDQVVAEGKQEAKSTGNADILQQRKRNKTLSFAFRTVGDGIAWRSVGYSRFAIRVMSQSRSPGAANNKTGRLKEIEWAKTAVMNGGYEMLHDATNILRVGDLSSYRSIPDITPYLAEVKSKKDIATAKQIQEKIDAKGSVTKQEVRLWQAQIMLTTRQWYGPTTIPVQDVTPSKVDFLAPAGAVMKQAEIKGVYGKFVAPYMYVDAFDLTVISASSEDELNKFLLPYESPTRSDLIVMNSSYDNIEVLYGTEVLRAVAPYTVFPFTSSVIAKLISGMLMTRTFLYMDPLKEAFLKYGYVLKMDEKVLDKNHEKRNEKDSVAFLSSEMLFPDNFEDEPHLHITHKQSGFTFPVVQLLAVMLHEYLSVEYIVSVAEFARSRATPGKPQLSYHDIRDSYRWL